MTLGNFILKIFYLILISLIIISCADIKDNTKSTITNNNNLTKEKQIIKITYGADPDAVKIFGYNTNGDIVKQNLSNGDTVIYDYNKSTITKMFIDDEHTWIGKIEYSLDDKGKILNSKTKDNKNRVVSKSIFEYNAEGYLIKTFQTVVETGKIFTNILNYANGNLKEIVLINPEGKILSKYYFSHYDDKPNVCNLFLEGIYDDIFPNQRLGKKNRNLVKEMTNISAEGDTLSILNYEYQKINSENLISYKMIDVLNKNETLVTYYFNKN